jgi:ribosomal protein L7/L12
VCFTGWRPGFLAVAFIKLVQERTDLGLKQSKDLSDALTDGGSPAVTVPTGEAAEALVDDAERIGADAEIEDTSG